MRDAACPLILSRAGLWALAIGLGLGNRPDTGPAVVVKSVLAGGAAAQSGKVRAPPAPLFALRRACLASRCLVLVRPHKDKTPVPSPGPGRRRAGRRRRHRRRVLRGAPRPPQRSCWRPSGCRRCCCWFSLAGGAAAADGARLARTPRRLPRAPARRAPACRLARRPRVCKWEV